MPPKYDFTLRPYELLVGIRHAVIGYIPLYLHVKIVFVSQFCNRAHHWGSVVLVDGLLVLPAVNQQNGLRIFDRRKVLIAKIIDSLCLMRLRRPVSALHQRSLH